MTRVRLDQGPGDPATFDALHTALRPRVLGYLARFLDAGEAEDVVQEVFLKVHRGFHTYRGEARRTTWVFQIATHAALDRLKSASHKASRLEAQGEIHLPHPPDQGSLPLKEEMCRCIRDLVGGLPTASRTILHLSELKELSLGDVAQVLGLSPGAAKIRLHRARKLLRARMERNCRILLDEGAELQCDRKIVSRTPPTSSQGVKEGPHVRTDL